MNNLKKVGLSALAGSLVAFSANAVELTVTGKTELTYSGTTDGNNGNKFGNGNAITFSGSGDMNGYTATYTAVIQDMGQASSNTSETFASSSLLIDMGDMGTLSYHDATQDVGIGKIDDLMPSSYEEPWDGVDFTPTTAGSGVVGRVDSGQTGFNYNVSAGMATINVGYSPAGSQAAVDDGGMSGDVSNAVVASAQSSQSIAIQADVMDGLMIFGGVGDKGGPATATTSYEDDHSTYGLKYTMGAITAGYQHSEIDDGAAGSVAADTETDAFGVAFAINENLTISYGYQETEVGSGNTDQELTGYAIGYSAGGMSIKAQHNEGEDAVTVGSTSVEMERTEILVGFAF